MNDEQDKKPKQASLRVSSGDIYQLIALALGGAVIASGVAIGNLYVNKKMQLPEFVQESKALRHDSVLCTKLATMGKDIDRKHTLYIAFLRVVVLCDQILLTYHEFQAKRANPSTPLDKKGYRKIMLSFQHTLQEQCVPTLFTHAKRLDSSLGAQQVIDMEEEWERVKTHVHQYVQNLYNFTEQQ